jgi:hypothetical protein
VSFLRAGTWRYAVGAVRRDRSPPLARGFRPRTGALGRGAGPQITATCRATRGSEEESTHEGPRCAPALLPVGRPPVAVPVRPRPPQITIADCRRILHAAQVMQLNTARSACKLYALARLEVWLRAMIKERP